MQGLVRRTTHGLVLLSAVAGCALQQGAGPTYVSQSYRPDFLNYSAGKGGMLTEIVGNPFPVPKGELDSAVTRGLEEAHFGPEMPFFAQAPELFGSPYKVVVLFNPAANARADRLCADPVQPQDASRGLAVMAAFCNGGDRITSTSARAPGASGPQDPAFRAMIRQLSMLLFPSVPGDPGGSGDDFESS